MRSGVRRRDGDLAEAPAARSRHRRRSTASCTVARTGPESYRPRGRRAPTSSRAPRRTAAVHEDGGMRADPHASLADSCPRILHAGPEGTDHVFAVLAHTSRTLAGAAGAVVVGWQPTGPLALAVSGPGSELPARRIPEGVTRYGGAGGRVVRGAGRDRSRRLVGRPAARPDAGQVDELRLLCVLAASASRSAADALYGVARGLLASRDREEILLGLATAAADVLRAEIAAVLLATPDGQHVETRAVVGHRSVGTARLRLAKGESIVGHVFATGQIYRSDDWTTDPVVSAELLPIGLAEGSQACIAAPVVVDGDCIGVLAAWRRRRSLFTDDDVDLIGTLADLAALGVQRAVADAQRRDLSTQLIAAERGAVAALRRGPRGTGDPPATRQGRRRRGRPGVDRGGAARHHRTGGPVRRRRGHRGRLGWLARRPDVRRAHTAPRRSVPRPCCSARTPQAGTGSPRPCARPA